MTDRVNEKQPLCFKILLAAVSAVAERALPALFFSVVALVPFWREIADFCRIFWEFCQKILKKPEKSPKSS